MFRHTMLRSALVLGAALGAVSTTDLVGVASAATPSPIATFDVTNAGPLAGGPVYAETVKKGARITSAGREK